MFPPGRKLRSKFFICQASVDVYTISGTLPPPRWCHPADVDTLQCRLRLHIFDILGRVTVASCPSCLGIRIYFLLILEDTVCLITVVAVDGTSGFLRYSEVPAASAIPNICCGHKWSFTYGVTNFADVMIERQVGIVPLFSILADIFKRNSPSNDQGIIICRCARMLGAVS